MFSWVEGGKNALCRWMVEREHCCGTDKVTEAHYCLTSTILDAIFSSLFFSVLLPLPKSVLTGIIMAVSAPLPPYTHPHTHADAHPHTPLYFQGFHNSSKFEEALF